MISESSIDQVKRAADIVDVISGFVKLKKHGNSLTGLCPFHVEKSPSFSVSKSRDLYKCFGCGRSGDTIAFLMEHEKKTYLESVRWLAEKYGIQMEEETKEFVKPVQRLEKLGGKALKFFESDRKISNNTLLRFKISESIEWVPQLKKEESVICFNYFKNEELINIKFRAPGKNFFLSKDAELIFYNIDALKGEKQCVIVEGEIDCMTFYECGIYNVISVPNGASVSASGGVPKLNYLDISFGDFAGIDKIIIATDNDQPGRVLRDELARRLGKERCYQVIWPEGTKDANEVLVKFGKEGVLMLVENSIEWPLEGIVNLSDKDLEQDVDDLYENGFPAGLRAHIPGFDELLTFTPGQLTIVTGAPGSGKSELVDWILTSLTKFHQVKWGIGSFETPIKYHIPRLEEKLSDRAFAFRKNFNHRITPEQHKSAKEIIKKYFFFFDLNKMNVNMDSLLAKAEEAVQRKGITGLVFDPWNCIEHNYTAGESETKYILNCLNKFIQFIRKYDLHGILVAHPTKLYKDKKTGKLPVPTLYDISGSAHFFNRTDNGIVVHREDKDTSGVDVYVQKVKLYWTGKLGFCSFFYDTMTREYKTVPTDSTELPEGNFIPITEEAPF